MTRLRDEKDFLEDTYYLLYHTNTDRFYKHIAIINFLQSSSDNIVLSSVYISTSPTINKNHFKLIHSNTPKQAGDTLQEYIETGIIWELSEVEVMLALSDTL